MNRLINKCLFTFGVFLAVTALSSRQALAVGAIEEVNNRVKLGITYYLVSPNDFETALSDTAHPFSVLGVQLIYERRLTPFIAGLIHFGHYSFRQPIVTANTSGVNYFGSGYSVMLGLSFYIINTRFFTITVSGEGGLSTNTAGNSTETQIAQTTSLSLPVSANATIDFRFMGDISIFATLGTLSHTLNSQNFTSWKDGSSGKMNMNLGGFYLTGGLCYDF